VRRRRFDVVGRLGEREAQLLLQPQKVVEETVRNVELAIRDDDVLVAAEILTDEQLVDGLELRRALGESHPPLLDRVAALAGEPLGELLGAAAGTTGAEDEHLALTRGAGTGGAADDCPLAGRARWLARASGDGR
jgi:hypothetical protein